MTSLRILKRAGKFYIQKKNIFFIWVDLHESNSSVKIAFVDDCPPFDTEKKALDWLATYIKFRTAVVYPVTRTVIA